MSAAAEGFVLGFAAAAERHSVPHFVFKPVGGLDRDATLDPDGAAGLILGFSITLIDGLSHSPQEAINWDDLEKGANLLLRALIRIAA